MFGHAGIKKWTKTAVLTHNLCLKCEYSHLARPPEKANYYRVKSINITGTGIKCFSDRHHCKLREAMWLLFTSTGSPINKKSIFPLRFALKKTNSKWSGISDAYFFNQRTAYGFDGQKVEPCSGNMLNLKPLLLSFVNVLWNVCSLSVSTELCPPLRLRDRC